MALIITKDNFQSELEQFKKLLKSNLFEYIIINNDFSTTNKKSTKENLSQLENLLSQANLNLYGTDKPDLRYDMLIQDITDIFKDGIIENQIAIRPGDIHT